MKIEEEPPAHYPLSSQQCGVHVDGWQEHAPVHAILIEGPGEIESEMLRDALDRMIERHEILRTCYGAVVGLRYPAQQVRPALAAAWKVLDAAVDDLSLLEAARSLVNLQDGPIVGAVVAVAVDGRLRWALAIPAYNVDARALQELAAACVKACVSRNRAAEVSDIIQYPDYVAWQSDLRDSDLGREGIRYWINQATATHKPSRLPFETGSMDAGLQAERLELTQEARTAVAGIAGRLNLSVDVVMMALWSAYMARVLQNDRMSVDWHADARTEELQGALGCFTLKLPVSLDFDDEMPMNVLVRSVAEQLETAASWQDCFDAAAHADHLATLGTVRQGIEFVHVPVLRLPDGWTLRHIELDSGDARLQCLWLDAGDRQVLHWQGTANHVPGTLQTWMRQFVTLLESAGRDAEQRWIRISLLGEFEREHMLGMARAQRLRGKGCPRHFSTLHGLFEAQARRIPESLAVVCGEVRLTYGELDRRADTLACRLRNCSVAPEQRVGIHLGRSVDVVTAMLAVLKSGAAYVPLDPTYPQQRIDDMVADAGIAVVIGSDQDRARFTELGLRHVCAEESDGSGGAHLAQEIEPHQLAYVIYTSGSTGRPKGVMVSHANAVASTLARFTFYRTPVAHFLLLSSPSFDSSVAGIYWTLGQGGTLYIPTEGLHQDTAHLAALIVRERISHLLALPAFYQQILADLRDAGELNCAIVAGESCHSDVVELHRRTLPAAALVNEYGPTEGTVWSNAFQIDSGWTPGMRVPIGPAIGSMYGYVLDERLELCPVGIAGEWCIGGAGIVRGYAEQPKLTAQRFVADPFEPAQRLYRTGDRVRLRPDGAVEYLGRGDKQVKLRGYRIELDEIESALRCHPEVRDAAVFMQEDDERGPRLAGFFVAAIVESQALRDELFAHLRRVLPTFMVPTHLVSVASLPRMANGKVDRPALLTLLDQESRVSYVVPTDDTERALAKIWQSVLKVERVGLKDSFFDLGGHSLLATQVASRIRQKLGVDLPLKDLFDTATLGELASRVRQLMSASHSEVAAMESVMAEADE